MTWQEVEQADRDWFRPSRNGAGLGVRAVCLWVRVMVEDGRWGC